MTKRVDMPALGENVTEGIITRWLKKVGDQVEEEEPLLEVATDKVDTEIPSPFSGTITEILAEENATVQVGEPLAVVDAPKAQEAPKPPPEPDVDRAEPQAPQETVRPEPALEPAVEPPAPEPVQARQEPPPAPTTSAEPTAETPATQRAAAESGARVEKMSRLRQTIARRMVESLQVAAQLTTVLEVDVTEIARLRARHKDAFRERTGVSLSFLPFFAKAAVEALNEFPMLNASVNPDSTEVTYHGARHLGVAVDAPRGLMVPVIRNAENLRIEGLATAIADLARRTREGGITADELSGGTFTLTNTGSRGALFDTPIINQPQSAILGTGAVVERVAPVPDEHGGHAFTVRSMAYLSVSYDHRIVDGADAARFLVTIKDRLENGFSDKDVA